MKSYYYSFYSNYCISKNKSPLCKEKFFTNMRRHKVKLVQICCPYCGNMNIWILEGTISLGDSLNYCKAPALLSRADFRIFPVAHPCPRLLSDISKAHLSHLLRTGSEICQLIQTDIGYSRIHLPRHIHTWKPACCNIAGLIIHPVHQKERHPPDDEHSNQRNTHKDIKFEADL